MAKTKQTEVTKQESIDTQDTGITTEPKGGSQSVEFKAQAQNSLSGVIENGTQKVIRN